VIFRPKSLVFFFFFFLGDFFFFFFFFFLSFFVSWVVGFFFEWLFAHMCERERFKKTQKSRRYIIFQEDFSRSRYYYTL